MVLFKSTNVFMTRNINFVKAPQSKIAFTMMHFVRFLEFSMNFEGNLEISQFNFFLYF